MTKEVANFYRSGKDDPSHIAGIEKMSKKAKQRK